MLLWPGRAVEAETLLSRVAFGGAECPSKAVWRLAMRDLAQCCQKQHRAGEAVTLLEEVPRELALCTWSLCVQVLADCEADTNCPPGELYEIKHELAASHRLSGNHTQAVSMWQLLESSATL